ncbi:MAG: hypothetical protein ACRCXT_13190 [Paraclostridium sp.]
MTKVKFNKLSISEQIRYFNLQLNKGLNIREVCRSIDISYSTIKERFKRNNYVYSKLANKYENIDIIIPINEISHDLLENISAILNSKYSTLDCEKRESKLASRSFRLHECVLNDFIQFCSESEFTQQEILSQFIAEGLVKYNKNA